MYSLLKNQFNVMYENLTLINFQISEFNEVKSNEIEF